MNDQNKARLEFWNERAALGLAAGSNDMGLKRLEIENICKHLRGCYKILDAGCGNGITAINVLKKLPSAKISAFDYSPQMVEEGIKLREEEGILDDRLEVTKGDLLAPPFENRAYDAIYTERSLINLNSPEEQMLSIAKLATKLKPGGKLIICESFVEGLAEINSFRVPAGLPKIESPWHNTYLSLDWVTKVFPDYLKLNEVDNFSSTYYFLSRVVNAWIAQNNGEEPSYDSPINNLSFSLPCIGTCAQTKTVIFSKFQQN